MSYTKEAQLPIKRYGTPRNPQLTDGITSIEMTYPPEAGSPGPDYLENMSLSTTIGGLRRKQSDSWLRRIEIRWVEPSGFIPDTIFEMMQGGGDRTKTFTYTHHRPIQSQLGTGRETTDANGVIPITGFIEKFKPVRIGQDGSGTQMHACLLIFQESDEVTP